MFRFRYTSGSRRTFLQRSKAESYVGFCIKAGKLTCGFNAVEQTKKDVFLLLLCESASENAKKSARALMARFGCRMLLCKSGRLEALTGRPNCKLAAVRDKNLANAILSATDDHFREYAGGNE